MSRFAQVLVTFIAALSPAPGVSTASNHPEFAPRGGILASPFARVEHKPCFPNCHRIEKEEKEKEGTEGQKEREEREAREKIEREEAEKAKHEKEEREAKEKSEKEAAEKAQHEKEEREAKEKVEKEQTEKEAAEKAQHEKEAHEKAEKEQHEREVKEKAEREAREKAEREQKEREEKEHPSTFLPGMNVGYWGSGEFPDLATAHMASGRLDTPTGVQPWEEIGLKVVADMSGPYSEQGVSGVNVSSYIARDVALVKKSPRIFALETLNEPDGSWFWGPNAKSAANGEAYGRLVVAVHEALVKEFGSARPLQYCAAEGETWTKLWYHVPGALAACDAVVYHPYGHHVERSKAILGDRGTVEAGHALTGKPVAITEVGFPTLHETGDSLQYTEKEQAWAVYHFLEWAKKTGYVTVVHIYGYRDSKEGAGYGLERNDGSHKPGWTALQQFSEGKACTVC